VNCSDTTSIPMGLEQGRLSDEQIAVQVVREFLNAWAAKDYDKATRIYGYRGANEARSIRDNVLQKMNVLRVLAVESPVIPERPLTGLRVPCVVEYEQNGRTGTTRFGLRISKSSGNRWRIRDLQLKETR